MISFEPQWQDLAYLVAGSVIGWLSKLLQNIPQKPPKE